jgi:IS30 family transposase
VVPGRWPGDPLDSARAVRVRLSLADREEIACLRAAGGGVRQIGRTLSRDAATISRELRRGTVRAKTGYRASVAQAGTDARAARPKGARLAVNDRLREHVQDKLARKAQSRADRRDAADRVPSEPGMRMSHETICQSLYVQGRGALRGT